MCSVHTSCIHVYMTYPLHEKCTCMLLRALNSLPYTPPYLAMSSKLNWIEKHNRCTQGKSYATIERECSRTALVYWAEQTVNAATILVNGHQMNECLAHSFFELSTSTFSTVHCHTFPKLVQSLILHFASPHIWTYNYCIQYPQLNAAYGNLIHSSWSPVRRRYMVTIIYYRQCTEYTQYSLFSLCPSWTRKRSWALQIWPAALERLCLPRSSQFCHSGWQKRTCLWVER